MPLNICATNATTTFSKTGLAASEILDVSLLAKHKSDYSVVTRGFTQPLVVRFYFASESLRGLLNVED